MRQGPRLHVPQGLEQDASPRSAPPLVGLPPLTLDDALSVALLICEREPENAKCAAVRWLRKLLERPGVTLAELREALDACVVLVEDADSAEASLRRLAGG